MITKLTLKNFKSIGEQSYEFTDFDLLVGRNNSGKSTILQALAIWQFCIDEFHRSSRRGGKGIQIILPNFTALPVPEFNLLWTDKLIRKNADKANNKPQEYVLIGILVEWRLADGKRSQFGIDIRYHSPQTIYAIPSQGWAAFRKIEADDGLPRVTYVPPFSGLEPEEKGMDQALLRYFVGKAQPGSVLRNLLVSVSTKSDWGELAGKVKEWFNIDLVKPKYDPTADVNIKVEYRRGDRNYDIITGGSGFHQTLTLLAFLYGYHPTTILLDEPDAHLHVNLQREIVNFFKEKAKQKGVQFLIATHAEEFINGVDESQIISLLHQKPKRISSRAEVIRAMADLANNEIVRIQASPFIIYVEGESDQRILEQWAQKFKMAHEIGKISFKIMGGGNKDDMNEKADKHFMALKVAASDVKRLVIFDYDNEDSFHPPLDNPVLFEWKRKNIENYLFVTDAWNRAVLSKLGANNNDLFAKAPLRIIDEFLLHKD